MPRVDFYVDQYDELILQKGMNVLWEQAMSCYCLSDNTGQPDFNCSKCRGSGFIYLPAIKTKVVVAGLGNKFELATIGMVQKGTAYATSLSKDLMGYHDRLTFIDFNSKYSQTTTIINGKSTRLHKPAKEIIKCLSIDFESLDENIKLLDNGFYLESTSIPNGTKIALLYKTSPSYIIDDITHELRATFVAFKKQSDTFKELPKQYFLKREDFVYEYNQD